MPRAASRCATSCISARSSSGYDQLHVATGARPTRPDLPGIDGEDVLGVQTLDDAKALLERARTSHCRNVVVVGGGYIGLEMAEAFVRWGASVTLVEGGDQLMRTLDADMAARLVAPMQRMGIDVRLGARVAAFEPGARRPRGWRRWSRPTSSSSASA